MAHRVYRSRLIGGGWEVAIEMASRVAGGKSDVVMHTAGGWWRTHPPDEGWQVTWSSLFSGTLHTGGLFGILLLVVDLIRLPTPTPFHNTRCAHFTLKVCSMEEKVVIISYIALFGINFVQPFFVYFMLQIWVLVGTRAFTKDV